VGEADDREEDDPGDDQHDPDSEHQAHGPNPIPRAADVPITRIPSGFPTFLSQMVENSATLPARFVH
jgi:hypothetical protein